MKSVFAFVLLATALVACRGAAPAFSSSRTSRNPTMQPTKYATVAVDGVNLFYREAGPPDAPALVLLHGFPSSSRMFDSLIPLLADRYHLIAPDYPGFGQSDAPDPARFAYTFDHLASVVDRFLEGLGIAKYAL